MNKKNLLTLFFCAVLIVFMLWFAMSKKDDAPLRRLPYFGPRNYTENADTSYHVIPPFEFTDQDGNKVSNESVKERIYVTEFFFTTCKSICPIMNRNMEKLYSEFKDEKDLIFLSHTVDPETDSVPVLKAYANERQVKDQRWKFLTGSKQQLYYIARKGYLLNAEEGNGGPEDFIHTQNFALVDKDRHIRGFYDGTDSLEMDRLRMEIRLLLKEYTSSN
jgi:protein SCO1/2